MDHPDLNVLNFMDKSIGLKRVERTKGTYEYAPDILCLYPICEQRMQMQAVNAQARLLHKCAVLPEHSLIVYKM